MWLADSIMCKINQTSQDFLLDQFKNYPEAVITIKRNSIGTRTSSSQEIQLCPSLTPDRTTNYNNNVLKAGIIQKMLSSIQSNFSSDNLLTKSTLMSQFQFKNVSRSTMLRMNYDLRQVHQRDGVCTRVHRVHVHSRECSWQKVYSQF